MGTISVDRRVRAVHMAMCVLLASAAACTRDGVVGVWADPTEPTAVNEAQDLDTSESPAHGTTTAWPGADGGGETVSACEPPDVFLVLDRTTSMYRAPDGELVENTSEGRSGSKWYLAIDAIEGLVMELDGTIRFGLGLFPADPGGEHCVTLQQRLDGAVADNPECGPAETLVAPAIGASLRIVEELAPETTRLCRSTPIGAALEAAAAQLESSLGATRERIAILMTDGRDTCGEARSIEAAQQISANGGVLHVLGFDGSGRGIDSGHLNDLACAGRTARGFPDTCIENPVGDFVAAQRDGAPLYILAEDQEQLGAELERVAGSVCCNCPI